MQNLLKSTINENRQDIWIVFFLGLMIQVFPSGMAGGHNWLFGDTGFPFAFFTDEFQTCMGINEYAFHFSLLSLLGNLIVMLLIAVAITIILKSLFGFLGLDSKRLTSAPVIYFGIAISLFFALRSWSMFLILMEANNDVPFCHFFWGFPLQKFYEYPRNFYLHHHTIIIANLSIILILSTTVAFIVGTLKRAKRIQREEMTLSETPTESME